MKMNRRSFIKAGTALGLSTLIPPIAVSLAEEPLTEETNMTPSQNIHGSSEACSAKADQLVLGNIVTLDARYPILEAMTIRNGIIQYVGTEAIARKLCDEHTEVMDYGDNYIYPGTIDAHCHGSLAGPRIAFFANLTPGTCMQDYVDIMKEFIEANPDNKAYFGAGWSERECPPNAAMLDAICTDKPMVLNSVDGHSMWFNTKGMEEYGINADAVAEWGTDIIRVNADGTPTGYISEGPVNQITVKTNTFSLEESKTALLKWQEFALSLGMTAYYEAGINELGLQSLRSLIDEGKWKLRVYSGWLLDESSEDYVADARTAKAMAEKYNCEYLQVIGVKIFMDGVVEAHTAWTVDPYNDRPDYTGVKRFRDHDRVVALYKECVKLGLNVHQHTIGDGAVKFALDCMEEAQLETGCMNMRNALAHLQMVEPEDIERLAALNAIAVVAPLWMSRSAFSYYQQSIEYIGDRRTFYSYPLNSFLRKNAILAFHTDYPVSTEASMPNSIYMACRRTDPHNEVYYQWNPDECISREDALAGITTGPAYSIGQEHRLGCLRIGYVANMTVFDKNLLSCDLEEIPETKLIATVIDGKEVYTGK